MDMHISTALSIVATFGCAAAQRTILGFNYGASDDNGNVKNQSDFEREFRAARNLQGVLKQINTIRLSSNVQWQTQDTLIEASAAAVATNTSLLLGIWASVPTSIDNELNALDAAIKKHGSDLADPVVGILVGSEDLYRASASGVRNKARVGQEGDDIVKCIRGARARLNNTALANLTIMSTIGALGVDNTIEDAGAIFNGTLTATEAAAEGNKTVWITEMGWPYMGSGWGKAESTVNNTATFGGMLFDGFNVFLYTLRDTNPENKVKFAITNNLSITPQFNLACAAGSGNLTLPAAFDMVASINTITSAATGAGSMTSALPSLSGDIFDRADDAMAAVAQREVTKVGGKTVVYKYDDCFQNSGAGKYPKPVPRRQSQGGVSKLKELKPANESPGLETANLNPDLPHSWNELEKFDQGKS
ncbi:hypothetical protein yc1106_05295 [Curvularia clavata]|uniref:Glycoside hydrolase family 17 protein n=1 Tax=Curvularia clavata TaxID=95742 RepID=A0A9Q9DU29_CURCL|nr:hypothetical protein yc1106_05295 [Curvularia clavata]